MYYQTRLKGFSLVELLVVMFIITLLAAGTYTFTTKAKLKGQVAKTLRDTSAIASAMAIFNDDTGVWPLGFQRNANSGILELNGFSAGGPGTVIPPAYPSALHAFYGNIAPGSWNGPYLGLASDPVTGVPLNTFGGRYYTEYTCPAGLGYGGNTVAGCEYGIIITDVPLEAAQALDQKTDGTPDPANGSIVFVQGGPIGSSPAPINPSRCTVYKYVGQE